jgi:glutamate--cysteine ligase
VLIGAELEWLTAFSGGDRSGQRVDAAALAAALGSHAPTSISPSSPARPLPRGGSVTIEPGGQIEISSLACRNPEQLCSDLRADSHTLSLLLETGGIRTISAPADTRRTPERRLLLPRYQAMEESFADNGPFGKLMMCNTAATQVSVDAGADPAEVTARWTALYAVGPALVAAFACSPRLCGAPAGAWASQRMRTWLHLDMPRTMVDTWADPIAGYAGWALDVPLLCVRGADGWAAPREATFADWLSGALDGHVDRRPDHSDLDYHLTTLFPPVRAAGHLEVRYLDAQPARCWAVPIYTIAALMSGPAVVAEATALAAATAGRWYDAARCGLAEPEIRGAAAALLELAAAHTGSPRARAELDAAAGRCLRGVAPHEQEVAA